MKFIKTFERFGIIDYMDEQVAKYMEVINANPDKSNFRFEYIMNLNNKKITIPFQLKIDSKLKTEGELESNSNILRSNNTYVITLKKRDDESTLLHEVKHIDFEKRVKDCYSDLYFRANKEIEKGKIEGGKLAPMSALFYAYTENEFQSKYSGYYKDLDEYVSKLKNPSSKDIIIAFNDLLKNHTDKTWTWYITDKPFTFSTFLNDINTKILFKKIIVPIINNKEVVEDIDMTFYSIFHMIKSYYNKIKEFIFGRKENFTKEDDIEISRAIKKVENNINKKRDRYGKKMKKLIPLMIEKYVK